MKQSTFSSRQIGIFCIAITTIGFSTIEIVSKMVSGLHPFQMTLLRFFIGSLILFPFAVREVMKRKLTLKAGDYLFFLLSGILCVVVSMCLFQIAVVYTKAAIVAVIFSSNPFFTAPLARLFLKEDMSVRKWVALALSGIGIVLIFNPFALSADVKGMLLALVSAVVFSVYTVVGKTRVHRYGGLVMSSFSFLAGSLVLLIILLIARIPLVSGIHSDNIVQLLYLSLFSTGIGYYCYFTAMKHTSAIMTSTVFFIKPALASVLSFLILREHLSAMAWAGIGFIVVSSFLMLWQGRKKEPVAAHQTAQVAAD